MHEHTYEFRDSFGDSDFAIDGDQTLVSDYETVVVVTQYNVNDFESYSISKQAYLFTSLIERAAYRVLELCKLSATLAEACLSDGAGYDASNIFIAYHPDCIYALNQHVMLYQKAIKTAAQLPFLSSLASHNEPCYGALFEGTAGLVSHSDAIKKEIDTLVYEGSTMPSYSTLHDVAGVVRDYYISLNSAARIAGEDLSQLVSDESVKETLEHLAGLYLRDEAQWD